MTGAKLLENDNAQQAISELPFGSVSRRFLLQNFQMKMSLICRKINMSVKHVFIRIVSHQDSF